MDIYLSRHGQTLWNTEHRMQGLNNSPLTSEGMEGAAALGRELSSLDPKIVRCFVSPLPRALHTAQLALSNCDYKIPLTIEPLLTEMDLGSFEGMITDEASSLYPDAYDKFVNDPDNYVPVDKGESFGDVIDRARVLLSKFEEYKKEGGEGPVLVISHMIVVEALLYASGTMSVENLRQTGPIRQTYLYKITI